MSIKSKLFGLSKQEYLDDAFHSYTQDLHDLEKLLGSARQQAILQPGDATAAKVEMYERMIVHAQKMVLRIVEEKKQITGVKT